MMRTLTNAVIAFLLLFGTAAHAGEFGTPEEAKALAEKASAYFKDKGLNELIAKIQGKDAQFLDRDLYVFIANTKGVIQAHGAVPKLKGRNLYNMKDVDGTLFVQDMIKVAGAEKGAGWVDYKWPHPKTKKITDKTSYVIKLDNDHLIGVGAYK